MAKKRIAILGGGIGALAAALELTDDRERRENYEITVYQMGWRLGGKGASGRDPRPGYGDRILEHGLHVWGGFYHYAFRQLRTAYAEVDLDWQAAFRRQSHMTLKERVDDHWELWPMQLYAEPGLPGDAPLMPTPLDYWKRLIGWMRSFFRTGLNDFKLDVEAVLARDANVPACALPSCERIGVDDDSVNEPRPEPPAGATVFRPAEGEERWERFLDFAERLTRKLADALDLDDEDDDELLDSVSRLVDRFADGFAHAREIREHGEEWWRRTRILFDIASTVVRGMLVDGVLRRGFDAIDHIDLRDWLVMHGIGDEALASPIVRGGYEYCFAFADGDPGQMRQGAGTAIRGTLRMLFASKGDVFWEMRGSMGEVVFTPIYQALVARGVRFRFFHRVDRLELSSDEQTINAVHIGVQAALEGGDPESYQPLLRIGPRDVWPAHPLSDQLQGGDTIAALHESGALDFESPYPSAEWPDVDEDLVLRRGEDFDDVILGIPVGDHRRIAAELITADARWREMTERLKTVPTIALQLWLGPDTEALGWPYGATILTAYQPPFATWADLSFLADIESWPKDARPGSIAYFCGALPPSAPRDKQGADAWVRRTAEQWLRQNAPGLWPAAVAGATGREFDFETLTDPEDRRGAARLDAQYWRANVYPSERYVMHPPGSSRYRLHPARSGFQNLFLAGDWTKSGINAGCIECAVMGGIIAARAIYGETAPLPGETDF